MTEQSARPDKSTSSQGSRGAERLSRLYLDALRANDAAGAYRMAAQALEAGMPPSALYQQVIAPAMYAIGELWEKGAITVADEHLATALTHRVLAALRPPIQVEFDPRVERPEKRSAMLATVQGERHALGLRMVSDVLEDAGYRTVYLGADVPTGALLQAISSLSPDLLVLSVTMPELAASLEETVARLRRAHPDLELVVGGQAAPLSAATKGEQVENLELLQRAAAA